MWERKAAVHLPELELGGGVDGDLACHAPPSAAFSPSKGLGVSSASLPRAVFFSVDRVSFLPVTQTGLLAVSAEGWLG